MNNDDYQALRPDRPEWGQARVLRRDSDVFGFEVADYRTGEIQESLASQARLGAELAQWAGRGQVELIGSSVPATNKDGRVLLSSLGFSHVETALRFTIPRLQRLRLPRREWQMRPATLADQSAVEAIASEAFRVGRYHADPRFPPRLASERFRYFAREAMNGPSSSNYRTYVTGYPAKVFVQVKLDPPLAHVTLGGTSLNVQGTPAPLRVWFGLMLELQRMGIERVQSKLSASNTQMMNVAVSAGARFSEPEHVFHWHAAIAPHLLAADQHCISR